MPISLYGDPRQTLAKFFLKKLQNSITYVETTWGVIWEKKKAKFLYKPPKVKFSIMKIVLIPFWMQRKKTICISAKFAQLLKSKISDIHIWTMRRSDMISILLGRKIRIISKFYVIKSRFKGCIYFENKKAADKFYIKTCFRVVL